MSNLKKKLLDSVKLREEIENEIQRKFDKVKINILNEKDFFDNYFEEDVTNSIYKQRLFFMTEQPELYSVITKEQVELYDKYVSVCKDTNQRILVIIREHVEKYFPKVPKYVKQAVDEGFDK